MQHIVTLANERSHADANWHLIMNGRAMNIPAQERSLCSVEAEATRSATAANGLTQAG